MRLLPAGSENLPRSLAPPDWVAEEDLHIHSPSDCGKSQARRIRFGMANCCAVLNSYCRLPLSIRNRLATTV